MHMPDSAKGIPDRDNFGDLSKINEGDILDLIIQKHEAERAGEHFDIRLGDKDRGLYSWATRKGLPANAGDRVGLFRQPMHSHEYGDFQGDIVDGYGKGRVSLHSKDKALVTSRHEDGSISLTTAGSNPVRYRLIPTKNEGWLVVRGKDPDGPMHVKEHMKSMTPEEAIAELKQYKNNVRVQPKIDGALQILRMSQDRPEIFSHRLGKTGRPIVHTERLFGRSPRLKVPDDLVDKEFLGETYALDSMGKMLPPQQLGGLLNSNLSKALEDMKAKRIKLHMALHDIAGDPRPYDERIKDLHRVAALFPDTMEVTEDVSDSDKALKLISDIQAGKHPKTSEGVIVRDHNGVPRKVKFLKEQDVWVRDTFPGEGKFTGSPGGFTYSLTQDGPVVGRVGTGFDNDTRAALSGYIGRVARVKSNGSFPSGALREPSFLALHEDYPNYEMKQASVLDAPKPIDPTKTGPDAIYGALKGLDLDAIEANQRKIIKSGGKSKRGDAVKILNTVVGLRNNNLRPEQLMINNVPVLPAKFRPFAVVGSTFTPGDANELYKDLFDLKAAYEEEAGVFGKENAGDARLNMYDAVRATYGYADPVKPKTKQRGVSGFVKKITGTSPKFGWVQRKLIGKTQDSVARGTIAVDPDLSLDEVGVPEDMAWTMYAPYIQRRLVRSGVSPKDAVYAVKERSDHAKRALEREMTERPVIYSRAPSWHKFNVISGRPKLIQGHSIAINPLVTTGLNADFDGDQMNLHVPSQDDAVKEAWDVLMPSKMLFSIRDPDKVMPALKHEQVQGLFTAQKRTPKASHVFPDERSAIAAIKAGQVNLSDEVTILDRNFKGNRPVVPS